MRRRPLWTTDPVMGWSRAAGATVTAAPTAGVIRTPRSPGHSYLHAGTLRSEKFGSTRGFWVRPTSCRYAHPSARCYPIEYSPWVVPRALTFSENIWDNNGGRGEAMGDRDGYRMKTTANRPFSTVWKNISRVFHAMEIIFPQYGKPGDKHPPAPGEGATNDQRPPPSNPLWI